MSGLMDPETHKIRLNTEQCRTCVGRPGNIARLRAGRLKELVRQNTRGDSMGLICHETIDYSDGHAPEYGGDQAICRWFYDTYGHQTNGIRVMERIGGFTEVPPPGEAVSG